PALRGGRGLCGLDQRDVLANHQSGSSEATDLERAGSLGPRINDLALVVRERVRPPFASANNSARTRAAGLPRTLGRRRRSLRGAPDQGRSSADPHESFFRTPTAEKV